LQDTYHVPVGLSALDWDLIASTPRRDGSPEPPKRDVELADGQKITVGDTTVTIVLTPGHTPASVSSIFPVKDRGVTRVMADWGGSAYPATSAALNQMGDSIKKFGAAAAAAHAEGLLNTHQFFFDIREKIADPSPNDPNALVLGPERLQKTLDIMSECLAGEKDWYAAMGR
jgi:metallo-beta-lactamase class B